MWGARDNLKFKKLNNPDTTEYKREYYEKKGNLPDKQFHEILKKNNIVSHIKNIVGNDGKDTAQPNYNEKFHKPLKNNKFNPKKRQMKSTPYNRPKHMGFEGPDRYGDSDDES